MGAISGVVSAKPRHDLVEKMMVHLSHRGADDIRRIENGGIVMQMSRSEIEKSFDSPQYNESIVWDGILPSQITPANLSHWPNPFAVAAATPQGLFMARNLLGVKPLYYGAADGVFCFASEVKALMQATPDIHEFPVGHYYTERDGFQPFASIQSGDLPYDDPDIMVEELRGRLVRAIDRYIVSDQTGVWLSGGVDSSVIATLLKDRARKVVSFVIGLPGASDIKYGQLVAESLGIEHHAHTIDTNTLLLALPEVIYALESFDALLVRSSVTHYLISKIASDYVDIIFTGEGGDELFAGYEYMRNTPPDKLPGILEDAVKSLHNTAFQRVDRSASSGGLMPCFPFANREVVDFAMKIPAKYKLYHQGDRIIEKWILRKVIEGRIPDSVLWRPKTKFWQGTGVQELLKQYAESAVTNTDFQRERILPNGWELASKEELMYYRLFKESYGGVSRLDWMGRTPTNPAAN
jgi:asparagine synthase (glutamine-hydrolysing)